MRCCHIGNLSPHRTDTWVIAADCDCQPRRAQRSRPASPVSTTHHTTHRVLSRLVSSSYSRPLIISSLISSCLSRLTSRLISLSYLITSRSSNGPWWEGGLVRVSLDPLGAWPSHGCQTMRKSSMGAAPVMVWQMAARVYGGGEAASVWMKHAGGSGG